MKSFLAVFALIITTALLFPAGAAAAMPCVATQIDRNFFERGQSLLVFARYTFVTGCPELLTIEISDTGMRFYDRLQLSVDRWVDSQWKQYGEQIPARIEMKTSADFRRTKIAEIAGLPDGAYRLVVANVTDWTSTFLEAVHFVVGSIPDDGFPRMPFIKSARVAENGLVSFRGLVGNSPVGYMYQLKPDGTEELVPVRFKVADSNLVNWAGSDRMDLPWVTAELPPNLFDSHRPIYVSVNASVNNVDGMTVQGIAFDPTDPAKFVTGSGLSPR
jgi:hypothetical protein